MDIFGIVKSYFGVVEDEEKIALPFIWYEPFHFLDFIVMCEHCSILKNEYHCAVDVAEQCACSSTA